MRFAPTANDISLFVNYKVYKISYVPKRIIQTREFDLWARSQLFF